MLEVTPIRKYKQGTVYRLPYTFSERCLSYGIYVPGTFELQHLYVSYRYFLLENQKDLYSFYMFSNKKNTLCWPYAIYQINSNSKESAIRQFILERCPEDVKLENFSDPYRASGFK